MRVVSLWVSGLRLICYICLSAPTLASTCNVNTDALGTSRVVAVEPKGHTRIGTMQYPETLPLADHEIVLSFDDGPSPRYTDRILDTLASECVKATFFMVGDMARTFPAEAKRVFAEGHTIGTHSFRHPFTFQRMSEEQAGTEIDRGIEAVATALGDPSEVAPFFRVPGFLTSRSTEAALAARGLMTWSADFAADDWRRISSDEIVKRALSRIEARGRGILLLHDIHQHTVDALPIILKELKERGYKIVQIVAANANVAETVTTPEQWLMPRHLEEGKDENQPSVQSNQKDQPKPSAMEVHRHPGQAKRMASAVSAGIRAVHGSHQRGKSRAGPKTRTPARHHLDRACRGHPRSSPQAFRLSVEGEDNHPPIAKASCFHGSSGALCRKCSYCVEFSSLALLRAKALMQAASGNSSYRLKALVSRTQH
jgi:peptidoglycan/xylan/chitin deacetylase (PgdA/CDA1 family)